MTPEVDAPMTLHARLEAAVRDAMRAHDSRRTTTLRMALAAAHNQRIARGRELTDEEVTEVVGREVKQRRESIEIAEFWRSKAKAGCEVLSIKGDHSSMVTSPRVDVIAERLRREIEMASRHAPAESRSE